MSFREFGKEKNYIQAGSKVQCNIVKIEKDENSNIIFHLTQDDEATASIKLFNAEGKKPAAQDIRARQLKHLAHSLLGVESKEQEKEGGWLDTESFTEVMETYFREFSKLTLPINCIAKLPLADKTKSYVGFSINPPFLSTDKNNCVSKFVDRDSDVYIQEKKVKPNDDFLPESSTDDMPY